MSKETKQTNLEKAAAVFMELAEKQESEKKHTAFNVRNSA